MSSQTTKTHVYHVALKVITQQIFSAKWYMAVNKYNGEVRQDGIYVERRPDEWERVPDNLNHKIALRTHPVYGNQLVGESYCSPARLQGTQDSIILSARQMAGTIYGTEVFRSLDPTRNPPLPPTEDPDIRAKIAREAAEKEFIK